MTGFLHSLLTHVPALVVLATVAALVFGEAAVFLGFVFPGETAVLLAGFLASTGRVSVVALAVVVVVAAIVGDSVGYEVGKRLRPAAAAHPDVPAARGTRRPGARRSSTDAAPRRSSSAGSPRSCAR